MIAEGTDLRTKESEMMATVLRELGLSYEEAAELMSAITKDAKALRSLWGKLGAGTQKRSQLIKLGMALIAFPIPTVGIKKSLGGVLIAAGLVQERIQHIHVTDVYATFQEVYRELGRL